MADAPVAFPTVSISVVVARNGDKFCVTDEKYGWYLPAGRVDYGESFCTAAVRESQEEAGLETKLEGILRFEYSFAGSDFIRFRCVFAAAPEDPNKDLKMEPDDESYGAAWFDLNEVMSLIRREPSIMEKIRELPHRVSQREDDHPLRKRGDDEKMRATEVFHLFRWAEEGTKVFDLDIFKGVDGDEVNNRKVDVYTEFTVQLVVKCLEDDTYLFTNDLKLDLPKYYLTRLQEFESAAEALSAKVEAQLKKKSIATLRNLWNSSRKKTKALVMLSGICGVFQKAPKTLNRTETASVVITYYAVIEAEKATLRNVENMVWKTAADLNEDPENVFAEAKRPVENCERGIIAPKEFLAWEGSPYVKLN